MLLGSWRPITLLETCYKLLSGCLASRINSKICKIVNNVQKGFIPGRNIVENVCLMYDSFHYAKENKKGGTALVLDYEKAFDSISHNFFGEVLNFFNFGENFIKWIKVCLSGFKACTLTCPVSACKLFLTAQCDLVMPMYLKKSLKFFFLVLKKI